MFEPQGTLKNQNGMALLAAMITVMVVSLLASSALWLQSRHFEVESATRQRQQAQWLLTGALDWSRVILREDARSSTTDTLVEPWAVPLQEAKLSSFIRAQSNTTTSNASEGEQDESLTDQVFLSGQITDLQSKLNFYNLFLAANSNGDFLGPVNASGVTSSSSSSSSTSSSNSNSNSNANSPQGAALSFIRLFDVLNLPVAELQSVNAQLRALSSNATRNGGNPVGSTQNSNPSASSFLMPQRFEQLTWLGLSESSIKRLLPHATWFPYASSVNLNTASAEVLYASLPGLDLSDAQRLIKARENKPWQTMEQFKNVMSTQNKSLALNDSKYQLNSRFFEVKGQIRIGNTTITEKSVLLRDNASVQILWRDKGSAVRFLDSQSP